ncbi:MAG: hypothetical protein M1335_05530 [Chloroflexi bacterium]|nr:hypothetical protein [Chloroflexota bacterium]
MRKSLRVIAFVIVCMLVAVGAVFSAENSSPPAGPSGIAANVSVSATDTNVRAVLESIAKQSKEKIIIESSVKGEIKLSLNNTELEPALTAICKAGKFEWRKVYIGPDSKLTDQPDKFASTVRLMSGLSFPDMVLAGSSINKVGAHLENAKAVSAAEDAAVKSLGMIKVYLVTNDAAIAAKAREVDKDKTEKSKVDKYVDMQKDQLDAFMKMSPEEREQAIMASLDLYDQIDPSYVGAAMEALTKADPDVLARRLSRQSDMMMTMSTDARRSMIKMGMKMQGLMSPDLRKMMEEDTKAVIEELKAEGAWPPPQQ